MSWGGQTQTQSYGHAPQGYGGGAPVAPSGNVAVSIQRANPHQSWGFRLQGGRDYRQQLCIKKVEQGSPADGRVQAGDGIISINGYDARELTHSQASNMIRSAGMQLDLQLQKGANPGATFGSIKPKGPVKFSPGTAHQFGYK